MSNITEANKNIELVNSTLSIIAEFENTVLGYKKELLSEMPVSIKGAYTDKQWSAEIKADIDRAKKSIKTYKKELEYYQEEIHYYIADYNGDYRSLIS